jgi:hypothetical protein
MTTSFANFDRLVGRAAVRRDAVDILSAGVNSVLLKPALSNMLSLHADELVVSGHGRFALPPVNGPGRLFVVAIGKAALAMSSAFEQAVEYRVYDGFAIGIDSVERASGLTSIRYVQGSHPLPCDDTLRNTGESAL